MMKRTFFFLALLVLAGCSPSVPFSELPKTSPETAWLYAEKSVSFGARCSVTLNFVDSEAVR